MIQSTVLWSLQTHSEYFLLYAHLGSGRPYSSVVLSLSDLHVVCLSLPCQQQVCCAGKRSRHWQ